MTYHHPAFAEAEAAWNSGTDPASLQASAMLPSFFGEEGPDRDLVIGEQRRAIKQWIARNAGFAAARREIVARCNAAFAAEGLA